MSSTSPQPPSLALQPSSDNPIENQKNNLIEPQPIHLPISAKQVEDDPPMQIPIENQKSSSQSQELNQGNNLQNNQNNQEPLSKYILITTDSGNCIYADHDALRHASYPLATTQDLLIQMIGQGLTVLKQGKRIIVVEQFQNVVFCATNNPDFPCCVELLRQLLHDLYNLIRFRLGPQFFKQLKENNQKSQKSVLPVLKQLVRSLVYLYDTHTPTFVSEIGRLELNPRNLSSIRHALIDAISEANMKTLSDQKTLDPNNKFPYITYGSPTGASGLISHAILFMNNQYVTAVENFGSSVLKSPSSSSSGSFIKKGLMRTKSQLSSQLKNATGRRDTLTPIQPKLTRTQTLPLPPVSPINLGSTTPSSSIAASSPLPKKLFDTSDEELCNSVEGQNNTQTSSQTSNISNLTLSATLSPTQPATNNSPQPASLPSVITPSPRRKKRSPSPRKRRTPPNKSPSPSLPSQTGDSNNLPNQYSTIHATSFLPSASLNVNTLRRLIILAHAHISSNSLKESEFLDSIFLECVDTSTKRCFCFCKDIDSGVVLVLLCKPMLLNQLAITRKVREKLSLLSFLVKSRCQRISSIVEQKIDPFLSFIITKGMLHGKHLRQYFISSESIPNLAHFCFIDRTRHQVVEPYIDKSDTVLVDNVIRAQNLALSIINTGSTHGIVYRNNYVYSFRLWIEKENSSHSTFENQDFLSLQQSLSNSLHSYLSSLESPPLSQSKLSTSGTYLASEAHPVINPPRMSGLSLPNVADSIHPLPRGQPLSRQRQYARFGHVDDIQDDLEFPEVRPLFEFPQLLTTWFPQEFSQLNIFQLLTIYKISPSEKIESHSIVYRDSLLLESLRGTS